MGHWLFSLRLNLFDLAVFLLGQFLVEAWSIWAGLALIAVGIVFSVMGERRFA